MSTLVLTRDAYAHWVSSDGGESRAWPVPADAAGDVAFLLAFATTTGTTVVVPSDPLGTGRQALADHINACPNWDAQAPAPAAPGRPQSAWVTAKHRQGPRVSIGVREWMDDPYLPADLDELAVANRLADWEVAMGHRYQHNAGSAALTALRAKGILGGARWRLQNVATAEWWQPPANIPEWRWTGPQRLYRGRTVHRWDMRSAYLAAAAQAELPRLRLAPTGSDVDPTAVGYFRVVQPPSFLDRLIPRDRHGARWVTSGLMRALGATGEIIDSWTAGKDDRPGRLLRPWADRIRDGLAAADQMSDRPALRAALKAGYAHAIGLMAVPRGSIYRPDWRHLIIGTQQGSMWRRILRVHQLTDLWPVKVDVDSLWYATDRPDQVGEALGVGELIGRMRYEGEATL